VAAVVAVDGVLIELDVQESELSDCSSMNDCLSLSE
jgi:hypothetical protein